MNTTKLVEEAQNSLDSERSEAAIKEIKRKLTNIQKAKDVVKNLEEELDIYLEGLN